MPLANILGIASLLSYFQQMPGWDFFREQSLLLLAVLVTMFFTKIKVVLENININMISLYQIDRHIVVLSLILLFLTFCK